MSEKYSNNIIDLGKERRRRRLTGDETSLHPENQPSPSPDSENHKVAAELCEIPDFILLTALDLLTARNNGVFTAKELLEEAKTVYVQFQEAGRDMIDRIENEPFDDAERQVYGDTPLSDADFRYDEPPSKQ